MTKFEPAEQRYYDDHSTLNMYIREISDSVTSITLYGITETTIEITHELGEQVMQINRREYNDNHRETRRHISLNSSNLEISPMSVAPSDPLEIYCYKERMLLLYRAISLLTPAQRSLIYRVFWNHEKQCDIATEEGVTAKAINNRLRRIYKQLRKNLKIGGGF